jgi:hypothetical protein
MGRVSAGTGNRPVVRIRRIVSQQLGQRRSPDLMHGGSQSGFDRFQVESAVLASPQENPVQKSVYFAGNFLLDGFGRFFSWADGWVCSTGRKRQIFRLTSTNSPVRV